MGLFMIRNSRSLINSVVLFIYLCTYFAVKLQTATSEGSKLFSLCKEVLGPIFGKKTDVRRLG